MANLCGSFKNQKGFSLIETMIAAAIVAGLSFALMRIHLNSVKMQQSFESRLEVTSLMQSIQAVLSDGDACKSSLFNQDVSVGSSLIINQPFTAPPVVLAQANTPLGKYQINDIEVTNTVNHPVIANKKLLTVSVSFTPVANETIAIKPKEFMFFATTTPGNLITDCFGEKSEQWTCEQLNGGDYNAMAIPKCSLHATKDYFTRGMNFQPVGGFPRPNGDNITWIGAPGSATLIDTGLGTEFKTVAPDCPANTRPIACMSRQIWAGNNQLVTDFSVDFGQHVNWIGPVAPPAPNFSNTGAFNAGYMVSYFDLSDTYSPPNNFPRCKIRVLRPPVAAPPGISYFPTVRCLATSASLLP